jgi:predicted acyltransferase
MDPVAGFSAGRDDRGRAPPYIHSVMSTQTAAPMPRAPTRADPPALGGRLVSLDAFRGATIAAMLLVNNPGSWAHIYPPLRHADWHGWTPTDLIFPFFLFIVGVAIVFSYAKQVERGADRGVMMRKVARRSVVLIALGLALHAFPWWSTDLSTLRLPGVLQRIGVAYFFAAAIVLYGGLRAQLAWAAALLLGYWALMTLVPVPGYGAGMLDVPEATLAAYLDRLIIGTDHLWAYSRTWDPEGLLSTLPAIATVLMGVGAAHWLRSDRPAAGKARGLAAAGAAAIALGWAWGLVFPINKPIWTSSYVVFTGGMALVCLALCYWLIDVKGYRRWALPFVIYGVNAIAAFFLSSLFARVLVMVRVPAPGGDSTALKTWIYQNLFASWLAPVNASLAFAIAFVLVWLGLMWVLYRNRIFIKV